MSCSSDSLSISIQLQMAYFGHSLESFFFLKMINMASVQLVFVSSGICSRLITLQLQTSAFRFSCVQ